VDNGLECPKGTVKQPSGDRAFSDEVAEPGISEEDATRLQIGFTRGKVISRFGTESTCFM
jgi:hypothetical protein